MPIVLPLATTVVATNSLIDLIERIVVPLELGMVGTLTASSTTSLTIGNDARFRTNDTGANVDQYVGDTIYMTSGGSPTPNPNGISAYAPSTGVLTPSITYTVAPASDATFILFHRGVTHRDVKDSLNLALTQLRYLARWPLTLVADGDMETAGTTHWAASGASISKVSTTGNHVHGSQSLEVVAGAGAGYAQSDTIYVDPGGSPDWSVWATVRADIGTARLTAYDVTNSAVIASEDWTARGFGTLAFTFRLPATCEALAFRLTGTEAAARSYWDELIALPTETSVVALPAWVTRTEQIEWVTSAPSGRERPDQALVWDDHHWTAEPDAASPLSAYALHLDPAVSAPTYLEAWRPFEELDADADATLGNRELVVLAAQMELLRKLQNRAPSQEVESWRREYSERRRQLKRRTDAFYPKRVHLGFQEPF